MKVLSVTLLLSLIFLLISLSTSLKPIILNKSKTFLHQSSSSSLWEHYYDNIDGFGADHIIEESSINRGRKISSMV